MKARWAGRGGVGNVERRLLEYRVKVGVAEVQRDRREGLS